MSDRLQKYLAQAGIASRRAAEAMIEAGRVSVNGELVTRLGTKVDPETDAVRVDGKRVRPQGGERLYLLLNKPRGYVTTLKDPEGRPTVIDLVRDIHRRVYPVGRLDFNSEGLLLLTDDGELANELMHPRHGVEKAYWAKVRGEPSADAAQRLARGIVLEGRRTMPARMRVVRKGDNSWVELVIHEGRKHQVRKMLEAIGHPVSRLRRMRYGGLELGTLPIGAYRALSPREVAGLRRAAAAKGERTRRPRKPSKPDKSHRA